MIMNRYCYIIIIISCMTYGQIIIFVLLNVTLRKLIEGSMTDLTMTNLTMTDLTMTDLTMTFLTITDHNNSKKQSTKDTISVLFPETNNTDYL